MKIVHVCLSGIYNDGWGYQENVISEYNSKDGHDVTVIASKEGNISVDSEFLLSKRCNIKYQKNGVKVVRIPYVKFLPLFFSKKLKLYRYLYKTIDEINPDILFFHGTIGFSLHVIPKYKKNHQDCKIYIDNHADYYNCGKNIISRYLLYKLLWKYQIRRTVQYVEKYFGTLPIRNEFMRDIYGIPKDKIELLMMGVDEKLLPNNYSITRNEFREKYAIALDEFVVVAGGKIDVNKNFDKLLKAINEIETSNVTLLLFGRIEEECKDSIESLLTDRIKYVGWLTPEEIMKAFISSDLGVFPGLHSVLWEQAVSCELPCIFRKLDGVDHININGNSILLDDVSVDTIKKNIEYLSSDLYSYQHMKERAKKAANKMFYKNINLQFLS